MPLKCLPLEQRISCRDPRFEAKLWPHAAAGTSESCPATWLCLPDPLKYVKHQLLPILAKIGLFLEDAEYWFSSVEAKNSHVLYETPDEVLTSLKSMTKLFLGQQSFPADPHHTCIVMKTTLFFWDLFCAGSVCCVSVRPGSSQNLSVRERIQVSCRW